MTPEFSRPTAVDRLGAAPASYTVTATDPECRALAGRMQIPAILALECTFVLRRVAGVIRAEAELSARVVRECVVGLDEFETDVAEAFNLRFVPAGSESAEIDLEAEDEVPYAGTMIDLGEAAAEQLALALDPYPRKPGAGLREEPSDQPRPFAALEALRRRQ